MDVIERIRDLSAMAFHEKAGRSQGNSRFIVSSWFFSLTKFFPRRVCHCRHASSALSRSESFRSVHAGRPQFSRCCHLIGALCMFGSFSPSLLVGFAPPTLLGHWSRHCHGINYTHNALSLGLECRSGCFINRDHQARVTTCHR